MDTVYNLEYRGDKIITHWFVLMIAGLKDIFEGKPNEYLLDKKDGLLNSNVINWNIQNKNIKPKFPIKIHFTKGNDDKYNFVNDFQKETFEILSNEITLIEDIKMYKNNNTQIINNYGAIISNNSTYPFVDAKYFIFLRELFLSKYNFTFKNSLIYISRNKARGLVGSASENITRRTILNEDELYLNLSKIGFKKIFLEDYSVSEKIEIFNTAKIIVTPNGAGLTFSLFANKNTKIIELLPNNPTQWCDQYLHITKALDIPFYRFTEVKKDSNDNMIVNIDSLMILLKKLLA